MNLDRLFGPYEKHHCFTLTVGTTAPALPPQSWLKYQQVGYAAILVPTRVPPLPTVLKPSDERVAAISPSRSMRTGDVEAARHEAILPCLIVALFASIGLLRLTRETAKSIVRDFAMIARLAKKSLLTSAPGVWVGLSRRLRRLRSFANRLYLRWSVASRAKRYELSCNAIRFIRQPRDFVRHVVVYAAIAALILNPLAVHPSQAVDYFWDANEGTAGVGGTGNWNTTLTKWRAGSSVGTLNAWPNTESNNDAWLTGTGGTLTLNSGSISVNDVNVNPSLAVTIDASASHALIFNGAAQSNLNIGSSASLTILSGMSGTYGFTKSGAGTLILDSATTSPSMLVGGITVSGGTLQIGSALHISTNQVLRANAVSIVGGASLLTTSASPDLRVGALNGAGSVTLASGGLLTIAALSDATFSGTLAGTGGMNVRGGNGTTQTFSGNLTGLTNTVSVNSGATVKLTGTGNSTSGVLGSSGSSGLSIRGGSFVLDNTDGNTGAATGRLADTVNLTMLGGTFSLVGHSSGTSETLGTLTLNSGMSTISVTHNGGAGGTALTISDSGSLRDATGMTVNFVGVGGTLGSSGANPRINFNGTLFTNTTNGMLAGTNTNPATNQTIGWAVVNGTNWAGANGSNSIIALADTARNSANLTLAQNWELVNFSPSTTVTTLGGNIGESASNSIGALKISPTAAGQSLALDGNTIFSPALMLTGSTDFSITGSGTLGIGSATRYIWVTDPSATLSFAGTVTGSGPLTKSGDGVLNLNGGASQMTGGAINVLAGVLRGTTTTLGGGASTGAPNNTIDLRGGVLEISGGGSLNRFLGAGAAGGGGIRWEATTSNRGDGGFSAIGGNATVTLMTSVGGSTPASLIWDMSTNFIKHGYALIFGSTKADSRIDLTNTLGLDDDSSGNNFNAREIRVIDNPGVNSDVARLSGVISGGAYVDLIKTGDGELELTAVNTFIGNVHIQQGTLTAANASGTALVNSVAVVLADAAGATFKLGTNETIGTLTGGGTNGGIVDLQGNTLTVGDMRDATFAGVIVNSTGSGALTKQGSGTLILSGPSSYTGATNVTNGALKLAGGNNRLPSGTTVTLGDAGGTNLGTLDLNGFHQTLAGLVSNVGTSTSGNNNTVTSATAATLTLGGSGTYVYGAGTNADSGVITGAISVVKSGTGTQTLGDANTYSGGTTVSGGTLIVASTGSIIGNATVDAGTLVIDGTLSGGTLNVNSGGTLKGSGSTGAVTVNDGGAISPGNSVGQLSTGGSDLQLNRGAEIFFEFNNATGATPGTSWDKIDVTGGDLIVNADNHATSNQIKVYIGSWLQSNANPGEAANFDPTLSYNWLFIAADSIVVVEPDLGSLAGRFQLIDNGVNGVFDDSIEGAGNPYSRPMSSAGRGTFSITQTGGDLFIQYSAIPEPGSMALCGLGSLAAGWYGRRRLRTSRTQELATQS